MLRKALLIIGLGLMLTGCGTPPDIDDRLPEDTEFSYTGTIEPLEIDLYKSGTHQLLTDSGEVMVLQSRTINLSKYMGEEVTVSGEIHIDELSDGEVLTVTEIMVGDEAEILTYEDRQHGITFSYPSFWELSDSSPEIILEDGSESRLKISIFNTGKTLEEFTSDKETGEGTTITVGATRSLRFVDENGTRVYLPHPSLNKIYQIHFVNPENEDKYQEGYLTVMESFLPLYFKKLTGPICGGPLKETCEEGYICQLSSDEAEAKGICVDPDEVSENQACPFIAPPSCNTYEVASTNAAGCPTSYACLDDAETEDEEGVDSEYEKVFSTLEKYQDRILRTEGATILEREVIENEDLIVVTYEDDENWYQTTYSFTPSANEYNFQEKLHDEKALENDGQEDIDDKEAEEDVKETVGETDVIPDTFRTYENPHMDFEVAYHKNWFFRSFGSEGGSIWSVGFSSEEMDTFSDAEVTVEILEGDAENNVQETEAMYFIQVPRDEDSHFLVKGPIEEKETLEIIAGSIIQN